MVTHHFLRIQSTNAVDVLAGEDHLEVGTADHKAEAIEAGQQAEIFGPISSFASCRSLLEVI